MVTVGRLSLCVLLLAAAPALGAQTADSVLTPGRTLRITWFAQGLEQQIATVERFYRDTIFVKTKFTDGTRTVTESLRIMLHEVDRVEYSTAKPVAPSGGASGFVFGALLGAVIGGASLGGSSDDPLAGLATAAGVVSGALVGGLVGGIMGAVANPSPPPSAYQWRTYCTKPCRT